MTKEEWKLHYGVDVPITVADDGRPLCAWDGCPGCNKCRAVRRGAPTIAESTVRAVRDRALAKLTPEERKALGFR